MLTYPLFMGTWEIIIICFIVLLLFGGKKIPELMKGLGKGVKSFKSGLEEIEDEVNSIDKPKASAKKVDTTLATEEKKEETKAE